MDFTTRRQTKWEKEAAERRSRLKKKQEQEKVAQQTYEKQLAVEREAAKLRQLEAEKLAEKQEEMRLEEENLTGGVSFEMTLRPVRIDGEDDKVVLPESALHTLTQADALGRGVLTFRVMSMKKGVENSEKITHCGVREFSAKEGEIGLTDKVLSCLGLKNSSEETDLLSSNVHIKYIRMPKITYVKFQPVQNRFFNLGPIKEVLERNLRFHTAMSLHDELTIWFRGESYDLRVIEIKPDVYGTLVDTDVEVDLGLSDEYLASDRYKALQASETQSSTSTGYTLRDAVTTNQTQNTTVDEIITHNSYVNRSHPLPSIPGIDVDESKIIRCKIKTGSKTISRAFLRDENINCLFSFVRNEGPDDVAKAPMGKLTLSTRFPHRDFHEGGDEVDGKSFANLDLGTQEMFHLSVLS